MTQRCSSGAAANHLPDRGISQPTLARIRKTLPSSARLIRVGKDSPRGRWLHCLFVFAGASAPSAVGHPQLKQKPRTHVQIPPKLPRPGAQRRAPVLVHGLREGLCTEVEPRDSYEDPHGRETVQMSICARAHTRCLWQGLRDGGEPQDPHAITHWR